ncbi:hypothetical protein [Streptomyces sp. NPDC001286]
MVEPQINSLAGVLGSAARLSSMAAVVQPLGGLGELVRQSHVDLAPALKSLPPLINTLPDLAKMAGTLVPNGLAIQVGLPPCDRRWPTPSAAVRRSRSRAQRVAGCLGW